MKKRRVLAYIMLVVLVLLAGFILFRTEISALEDKEYTQCQMKLDTACEVLQSVEAMRTSSRALFEERLQQNIRFMCTTLAADVTEEGFTGPRLYEDGAVVEIHDGKAIWPKGIPETYTDLSAEDIQEGRRVEKLVADPDEDDPELTERMVFTFGRIADNYYYVDWTRAIEILYDQFAFLGDERVLDITEGSFGGSVLVIAQNEESLPLLNIVSSQREADYAADLGFTREIINDRQRIVQVNGERCLCAYAEVNDGAQMMIYMEPTRYLTSRAAIHTGVVLASILIILVTVINYIFSVLDYVKHNRLSARLEKRYEPKNLRRMMIMAGITGAIIIFVSTAVFQSMDTLHEESMVSAGSLNRLYEYLEDTMAGRAAHNKQEEEEWRVYQGRRIADLIARRPEAASRENLQEYCDIFGIDYLMLFDADGKETATNSGFSGLTMNTALGEEAEDFKRLLHGVNVIVHEPYDNPMTGLTRKMIGLSIPEGTPSATAQHGVLMMAIDPQQSAQVSSTAFRQIRLFNTPDQLIFFTDQKEGKILYSGNEDLIGKTAAACGLPEKILEDDTYTDYVTVDGTPSYVTMIRQKEMNFFYVLSDAWLFSNMLPFTLIAVASYLVILSLVLLVSLKGYNPATFTVWAGENAGKEAPDEAGMPAKTQHDLSELLVSSGRKNRKDEEQTPERKAKILLRFDILLLILIPTVLLALGKGNSFGGTSLMNFVLLGKWTRGLNIFSISASITTAAIGFVILLLCNLILSLISGFTGRGGETVCRLLYSLCRYVVILTVIYYIFEYMGLSLTTYFAGLGMVSLAISLGSRDMVSDIVSGLMILFENQFQVGDYVELDGCRGKVLEMGIRSTKLLTSSNDIRYISNSGIRSIVNKSKNVSPCVADITISSGEPLETIEETFNRVLPEIEKKSGAMISGLTLEGITRVSCDERSNTKRVSIRISCECMEKDNDAARNFINREIFLFCEREGITLC